MLIDFGELEAVCHHHDLAGDCEIMLEAEAVCQQDQPRFCQDCNCCEEHCPLKAESTEKANNSASPKLPPCSWCSNPGVAKYCNFCPDCGRQLSGE